jgi:hypothetical protein
VARAQIKSVIACGNADFLLTQTDLGSLCVLFRLRQAKQQKSLANRRREHLKDELGRMKDETMNNETMTNEQCSAIHNSAFILLNERREHYEKIEVEQTQCAAALIRRAPARGRDRGGD